MRADEVFTLGGEFLDPGDGGLRSDVSDDTDTAPILIVREPELHRGEEVNDVAVEPGLVMPVR